MSDCPVCLNIPNYFAHTCDKGAPDMDMPQMEDALEKIAHELFQIVNGTGDSGSLREFSAQNPAIQKGWIKLAKQYKSASV